MRYEYTSLEYADSFWLALDEVARERKYLLLLEGPEKEGTRDFLKSIVENNETQFLAIEDDRVIGWCDIIRFEREGLGHAGHVGMGVLKKYRGQGIGEKLLRMSINDAFAKGMERIELETFSSNERAVALYEKVGFITEGRKRKARCVDGQYDDFVIMSILREDWDSDVT